MNYGEVRERVVAALAAAGRTGAEPCRVECPCCVSSKTGRPDQSMAVKHGRYKCHRCGEWGYLEGWQDLAPTPRSAGPEPVALPDGCLPLWEPPGDTAACLAEARAYAASRGLTGALLKEWQVGATLTGYHAGRLVLPVVAQGVTVGWSARDYTGRAARKYLYPKGMERGRWLFNGAALEAETRTPLLVVEGILDATPFWPDVVPVLGQPAQEHLAMLGRCRRPVLLALDGDAHEAGWALALRLRFDGVVAESVRLPPRADPPDCVGLIREALRRLEAAS